MQVGKIRSELGWEGDVVENVPEDFNYEKIECWMQGVRDFIKYIKRGYTRPTHLAAIDLRNQRISKDEAQAMIRQFEGRRPPSLDLFLEYVGLSEQEFYMIATSHQVSLKFESSALRQGEKTRITTNGCEATGSLLLKLRLKWVVGLKLVQAVDLRACAAG